MIITGFANSPDGGQGLARDMVVRWALEELGQTYEVCSLGFAELKQEAHLSLHPFGQIPTLELDDIQAFETGAILLALDERYGGLLPPAASDRARALSWMFAAVATVEPVIIECEAASYTEAYQPWFEARQALIRQRIDTRLTSLSAALKDHDWLCAAFGAADILLVSALRRLDQPLLAKYPRLAAYVARAEARPAFQRAYAAQHQTWLAFQGG